MKYINKTTGEEMLLTTVTHRLGAWKWSHRFGAWKWASRRLSNRIIIREAGVLGTDLRFNGVRCIAESCYAGGRYVFNNGFNPSDLAYYAEKHGFDAVE